MGSPDGHAGQPIGSGRLRAVAATAIRHALLEADRREPGDFHALTYAREALGSGWTALRAVIGGLLPDGAWATTAVLRPARGGRVANHSNTCA